MKTPDPLSTDQCAKCVEHAREINPRPVWQCTRCGVVSISELCTIQDGNRRGWREAMEREFGRNFRYRVLHVH